MRESATPPFASDIAPADEDSLYDFNLEVPLRSSRDGGSVFTSNSSVTIPYDDQVAFQKESMYASPDGMGGVTESYMADPDDQFYRYTVEAPPGLLGMTLETSALDGTPSVYGIKTTSPLASDVQVGDRLMSVDGVGCERDGCHCCFSFDCRKEDESIQATCIHSPRGRR